MMKTIHQFLWAGALLTAQFAQAAPDFFRFEPGSIRIYRAQKSDDSFTIRVGNAGFMHNGHVHYFVTGYVDRPVLAYRHENTGALYHLDHDTDQDVLLTSVEKGPGWFQANDRPCDQEGQVEEKPVPYTGPGGSFPNALEIRYRAFGCADTGIASERYVENVGMVQRTVQTFAGSLHYDLVHASVGPLTVTELPSTTFSINLRRAMYGPGVIADLRWNAPGQGMVMQMPTSQDYEIVLRNAKGEVMWRWSDGKFFTPQLRTRSARHLSYEVEIPMQVFGILLPEGAYTVEAWLTTVQERQFAASIGFVHTYPPIHGSQRE